MLTDQAHALRNLVAEVESASRTQALQKSRDQQTATAQAASKQTSVFQSPETIAFQRQNKQHITLNTHVAVSPTVSRTDKAAPPAIAVKSASQAATNQLTRRAQIIAITSGKGGVGKSNLTVNLAIAMVARGKRVLVLDADLGTANIDVLCNMKPGNTLAYVLAGYQTLQDAMIQAPGGFDLIPGASGLSQVADLKHDDRQRLIQEIHQLEAGYDTILVDTAAGVGANVLSFALGADQVMVVTTPEPTAITDAYAIVKALSLQKKDLAIRIVVNMVQNQEEGLLIFGRLEMACRQFLNLPIQYAGHIERDVQLLHAVRSRTPLLLNGENTKAGQCIGVLAEGISTTDKLVKANGLLHRLSDWFRKI